MANPNKGAQGQAVEKIILGAEHDDRMDEVFQWVLAGKVQMEDFQYWSAGRDKRIAAKAAQGAKENRSAFKVKTGEKHTLVISGGRTHAAAFRPINLRADQLLGIVAHLPEIVAHLKAESAGAVISKDFPFKDKDGKEKSNVCPVVGNLRVSDEKDFRELLAAAEKMLTPVS